MMAKLGDLSLDVRLVPDEYTVELALKVLDLWQESNDTQMIVFDHGHYRIVDVQGR